jgi:UDPglucose 6-dehydrogenase
LAQGRLPLYEPGLDELVNWALDTGRLAFTGEYAEAIPNAQCVFICVNTPPLEDGSADVQNVLSATNRIIEHAQGPLTLVVKSTVPVGTGDRVEGLVASSQKCISVVSNPEFLRQGSALKDFLQPDRIVIGSECESTAEMVRSLYSAIHCKVIVCSRRSAELAKYAANALLATRISFMNEIATLCGVCEADIEEIASVLASDPRIGPDYLKAGLGWGGSCFPKDVRALGAMAQNNGLLMPIIRGAYDTNMALRSAAYDKIWSSMGHASQPVVGILGLAFKPNTDDLREAPAIDIARRLLTDGVRVRAHDPIAMANAQKLLPDMTYCQGAYEVADGADVLFLATEWPEYLGLDWPRLSRLMRGKVVIDGRNVLDAHAVVANDLDYVPFGRRVVLTPRAAPQEHRFAEADLIAAS